jgi:hypothetical protein
MGQVRHETVLSVLEVVAVVHLQMPGLSATKAIS